LEINRTFFDLLTETKTGYVTYTNRGENMSDKLNNQWRQNESVAIKRAERIARNLQKLMFVIYNNEEDRYEIVNEPELYHLIEQFDLDMDIVAEVS
jgi:protein-arginine kinase